MLQNIGLLDRILRLLLGGGIYALFLSNVISGGLGLLLLFVGTVLILTAFAKVCPIYKLGKIRTN